MKRAGALLLGLLILSFLPVKGAQVLYIDFEGFSVHTATRNTSLTLNTTYQTAISDVISLPSTRYLVGAYIKASIYNPDAYSHAVYMEVLVNGQVVWSGSEVVAGGASSTTIQKSVPFSGVMASTFNVELRMRTDNDNAGVRLDSATLAEYYLASDYSINATLTELKYYPPGAAGTPEGFILNRTSIVLNEYNFPQGTLSFWLKWDGNSAAILMNGSKTVIGIDQDGYLFVDVDGQVYTFPNHPPLGVYVPVYIGWSSSTGYIMINNTKLSINWQGNLAFDRIGNPAQESGTIIDELKVWDTYIPPDQVVYESQKEGYVLLWRGKAIIITPESGTDLGTLDVAFLNENMTTINSTTLSTGSKLAVVPNETALVVISRSGVSRRYWLGNYTEIAFPAENVQLVSSTISIRPTVWQYLTLKTPDGRVATRVKLDSTQTASVMAVLGSDYIISLENVNTTKSMLYTITGDISLWVENDTAKYQGKYFTAQLDDKLLIITYYDQSAETKELHISIKAYDANNNLKYEINDIAVEGPVAYYRLALPVSNDSDVMLYRITLNADGQIYERTVFGEAGGESVLPSNIVPQGLVIFGAGVVGALMFVAINAYLMPFGALIALSAVKFLGWANVPPYVLGMLGVFSALAMLMYRRDQGVG